MILALLISTIAFSDCKNLIERLDAEKMCQGIPHGKQFLKCETKDCVCIDDFRFEYCKLGKPGELLVDEEKKRLLEEDKELKEGMQKSLIDKLHSDSITNQEVLELLKKIFPKEK